MVFIIMFTPLFSLVHPPIFSAMMGIVPEQTATSVLHQCIPLYTLLAALGNPTVHWFILDIEGAELQVLHILS